MWVFAGFSSCDNSNITLIPLFKYNIILFAAHGVNVMWINNTNLGRRSPGGGRVLCREYVPSRHIRSIGRVLSARLVNSASLICDINRWPSDKVSASAYCGCWFDLQWWRLWCVLLMGPNKVGTGLGCLPDFLFMIILIYMKTKNSFKSVWWIKSGQMLVFIIY